MTGHTMNLPPLDERAEELRDERATWADETGRHVSEWATWYPVEAAELAELERAQ